MDGMKTSKKGREKTPAYEILAPAGSREALEAAVQNGADAVYLSGKDFGARKFAANFSRQELLQALDYCHERGVSVYVTVNTLLFNEEFEKLQETLDYYYTIGVDAVIVQDMGVLSFVRKNYPDFDIHCSTQMSVQTVEDIGYLESLGVKRVVLGREMSLKEIRRAKKETDVELEVFIHGALCISLSGQCLMSSMIGGRSGNRGSCAQPCRQKYDLYNEESQTVIASDMGDYLLSPKDLAAAEEIPKVVEAGGFSLKIEGRMKKPEYVATVVRVYRELLGASGIGNSEKTAMDPKTLERALEDLTIFNRGFTRGHLFGDTGQDFMSMKNPGNQGIYIGKIVKQDRSREKITIALERSLSHNDEIQLQRREGTVGGRVERLEDQGKVVKHCDKGKTCTVNFKHRAKIGEAVYKTFDEALMKAARQTYHKELLEIPIRGDFIFKEGVPIRGTLTDGKNTVLAESYEVPERARGKSLSTAALKKQLSKLGGTPYRMEAIDIALEGELFVPAKVINQLRRTLVEGLSEERIQRHRRDLPKIEEAPEKEVPEDFAEDTGKDRQITFTYSAGTLDQLQKLLELEAKIIYYKDVHTLKEALAMAREADFSGELIPEIYRQATGSVLEDYKTMLEEAKGSAVLVQAHGQIPEFSEKIRIGDYSLNIVNDRAYGFYRSQGIERVMLSPELTLAQIKSLKTHPGHTEIFGYGHLPVMNLKHCPVSTVLHQGTQCGLCKTAQYSLVDRKDEHFPLIPKAGCIVEVYNSKKHLLIEDLTGIEKAGVGYFRLNFVKETPEEVETVVRLHRRILEQGITAANEKALFQLRKEGVTKGHLFRGVE